MKKLNLEKPPIIVMLGGSLFGKILAKKITNVASHLSNENFIIFGSKLKIGKRKNRG